MNKKKCAIAVAATGAVLGGAVALGAKYFFNLGFVTRKAGEGPDMSVWNPQIEPVKRPGSSGVLKRRRGVEAKIGSAVEEEDSIREKMREGREWILSKNPERWHIVSHDGLPLTAHYIPAESPRGLVLMVHGYRSNGTRDFSCAAKPFHERGMSLLIIDNRGCGESGGRYMTYGVLERYDVLRWAEEAQRRLPCLPVILDGVSMGATTVLLASALPLPKNVRAIIADSGFTSPEAIFRSVMGRMYHLPGFPLLPIARGMCRRRCGFDFGGVSAAEAVKHTRVPILFAHGTGDTFVPHEMTLENYRNTPAGLGRLLIVAGAEHAQSYLVDTDSYHTEIDRLIEEICGE